MLRVEEPPLVKKLGLIAGSGRFPFLLLDAARAHGEEVVVAALKEETDPEMDARAAADPARHDHHAHGALHARLGC